jgi:hypothetical protein
MATSTDTDAGASKRSIVIEKHKTMQYWADSSNAMRATVCKINGYPRVGVGKFWFDPKQNQWFPSRKGHVYQSPEQWRAFATRVHALTQSLIALEKHMKNTEIASAGMPQLGPTYT